MHSLNHYTNHEFWYFLYLFPSIFSPIRIFTTMFVIFGGCLLIVLYGFSLSLHNWSQFNLLPHKEIQMEKSKEPRINKFTRLLRFLLPRGYFQFLAHLTSTICSVEGERKGRILALDPGDTQNRMTIRLQWDGGFPRRETYDVLQGRTFWFKRGVLNTFVEFEDN